MAHAEQNGLTEKKTPTSALAEFCVQLRTELPQYEVLNEESNPNIPIFFISANAFGFTSIGAGRSKIEAKHLASQNLIDILAQCDLYKDKLNPPPQPSQSKISESTHALRNNDAVGSLITFCQHHRLSSPIFPEISISGQSHIREFKIGCYVGEYQCFGVGSTKKEARQIAAQTMLKSIEQNYGEEWSSTSSDDTANLGAVALQSSSEDVSMRDSQSIDTTCISKLITICQQNYLKMPDFQMVSCTGQDHKKEFTFACIVDKYQCQGTATKKQLAKQNAAMAMIKIIEEKIEANELVSEDGSLHSSAALNIADVPTVEEVLAEYRRMKNKSCTPIKSGLRHRHDFFLKLPEQNQLKAKQILSKDHSNPIEARCIVHEAMVALELEYEIKRFGVNRAIFTLKVQNFECTIVESYDGLFNRIIDHLKTMLNMQKVSEALSDVTNQNL